MRCEGKGSRGVGKGGAFPLFLDELNITEQEMMFTPGAHACAGPS